MPIKDLILKANKPTELYSRNATGIRAREPIKKVRNTVIKAPFLSTIFLIIKAWATLQIVARNIKKFPKTAPEKPDSKAGLNISTITPNRLIKVPANSLGEILSFKKITDEPKRRIGPAEIIIGALILGASFNPKKRRGI